MATTIDIGTLIVETPGTCGGRPRIDGHRITVRHIINLLHAGRTPEEIADEHPQVELAKIYAAIAYYHANQEKLDADFATELEEEKRFERDWLAQRQKQ